MRVDGYAISGNATLFDGSAIETSQAIATVRLDKGTEIKLGSGSQGMLYRDHMVLQQGRSELSTSDSFQMQAGGFHVIPTDAHSRGVVSVKGLESIQVAAMTGVFQVTNSRGFVLAQVRPGSAMSFELQAGESQGGPNQPGATTALSGKLTASRGHFYVTEPGGAVHEVLAHDANREAANQSLVKFVDKHVCVRGTVDTALQPTGGATDVVDILSIDRGRCSAGGAAGGGGAAAGLGSHTTMIILAGGAVAAAVGFGIYESGGSSASR